MKEQVRKNSKTALFSIMWKQYIEYNFNFTYKEGDWLNGLFFNFDRVILEK